MRLRLFSTLFLALIGMLTACQDEAKKDSEPSAEISKSELLAMVMIDGKYGYIDTLGGFVIEPKYPLARSFSNGFACVNVDGILALGIPCSKF